MQWGDHIASELDCGRGLALSSFPGQCDFFKRFAASQACDEGFVVGHGLLIMVFTCWIAKRFSNARAWECVFVMGKPQVTLTARVLLTVCDVVNHSTSPSVPSAFVLKLRQQATVPGGQGAACHSAFTGHTGHCVTRRSSGDRVLRRTVTLTVQESSSRDSSRPVGTYLQKPPTMPIPSGSSSASSESPLLSLRGWYRM